MYDYKQEIIDTRKGCLGSSDGRILSQISTLGYVPKSAYKRLAELKSLIEHKDIPQNDAIRFGDYIENAIFNHLHSQDQRWESNVLLESKKYSLPNVKLISHPDFYKIDHDKKEILIGECKATKYNVQQTRSTYEAQLYIHYVLGREIASKFGDDWKVKLYLVHYSTDGIDLENGIEFDPSRLTVHQVYFSTMYFDIMRGMNLVNDFLETFTEYYEGDEIDANLLPTNVKSQFDDVAAMLVEIKERESKIEEFKKRLYDFMLEHDIKSIKNEYFSIVAVAPSESKSFDAKRYVEDLIKQYPRKSKKIIEKYTKTQKRKGYCQIKVKGGK